MNIDDLARAQYFRESGGDLDGATNPRYLSKTTETSQQTRTTEAETRYNARHDLERLSKVETVGILPETEYRNYTKPITSLNFTASQDHPVKILFSNDYHVPYHDPKALAA